MDDKKLEQWIKEFDKEQFFKKDERFVETEHKYENSDGVKMKIKSDGGSSSYYELPDNSKELMDLIEFRNMNFSIGNIFKACYRMGEKDGIDDLYDINKIIYYATREKERLERMINGTN